MRHTKKKKKFTTHNSRQFLFIQLFFILVTLFDWLLNGNKLSHYVYCVIEIKTREHLCVNVNEKSKRRRHQHLRLMFKRHLTKCQCIHTHTPNERDREKESKQAITKKKPLRFLLFFLFNILFFLSVRCGAVCVHSYLYKTPFLSFTLPILFSGL